jgi:hypothetical protein
MLTMAFHFNRSNIAAAYKRQNHPVIDLLTEGQSKSTMRLQEFAHTVLVRIVRDCEEKARKAERFESAITAPFGVLREQCQRQL